LKYRQSSTTIESPYNLPPLTEPLKKIVTPKYQKINSEIFDTHVTTLDNGLRVASEKLFGDFCTVGGTFSSHNSLINIDYSEKIAV